MPQAPPFTTPLTAPSTFAQANAKHGFDYEACQELMRGGSKTFFAASRLLPGRVRGPAIALYAFCRVADDLIDFSDDRVTALAALNERLRRVYANDPMAYEPDRALAAVVREFDLPLELVAALLEGFEWDAEGRRYETIEELQAYGARVAGSVGAMMAVVMRTRGEQALARACDLGVAMQLTNILRDVGEDLGRGRVYLPREDLDRFGASPWPGTVDDAWRNLMAFEITRNRELYTQAQAGVAMLPPRSARCVATALTLYAQILDRIEARDYDVFSDRARVPTWRKAVTAASIMVAGPRAVSA